MNLPEPQPRTFSSLINDIETGQLKIPQFQRDFVWDIKKSAHLLDSIVKGYPIGTFIFWRTKERLRTIRNIGNFDLREPKEGEFVDFVLDGQQRLTTLFASLKGLKVERKEKKIDDFAKMYINLEADKDEQIVITDITKMDPGSLIRITDILNADFIQLSMYPNKYHEILREYMNRIQSYNFSTIQIKEAPQAVPKLPRLHQFLHLHIIFRISFTF